MILVFAPRIEPSHFPRADFRPDTYRSSLVSLPPLSTFDQPMPGCALHKTPVRYANAGKGFN